MKRVIYKYIIKNEYNGKIVADSNGNAKIFNGMYTAKSFMENNNLNPNWFKIVLHSRLMKDE